GQAAVVIRQRILAAVNRPALSTRKRVLADSAILDVVGELVILDSRSARGLDQNLGQAIAEIPGVARKLVIRNPRLGQHVAVLVVSVTVGSVARQAVADASHITAQSPVPFLVVGV